MSAAVEPPHSARARMHEFSLLLLLPRSSLHVDARSTQSPSSPWIIDARKGSCSFTGNAGLCGIPGLSTCGPHLSIGAKVGIALGSLIAFLLFLVCLVCWWKRRKNILRAQKIAASREASYAKARTNFGRDVQMTKHSPHRSHDQPRIATDDSPALLS